MSSAPSSARFWALIPCAGTGSRAGTAGPKQYQPLAGQPLVLHTLTAFAAVPQLHGILLVLSPQDDFFATQSPLPAACQWAHCGGATRAQSVANGLAHLQTLGAHDDDWVLVHDAARCLITPAQITQLMADCTDDPVGGLLAHKLPDTLKQERPHANDSEGGSRVAATLERSDKWLAQTPQMFRLGLLQRALAQAGDQVTDESSAVEALGLAPRLVPGSAQNFKVTYPEDFALADVVLRARATPERKAA